MSRISDNLRQQVIDRALARCEYCQTQQIIVISMEIDHIIAESAGGETAFDNLCLACIGCNGFKLDFQTGLDPESGEEISLFNPRTQTWQDHFRWSGDGIQIIGETSTGRATISRLKMNRDPVLDSRRMWVESGWHPPAIDH